jgi:hypothetical protein
MLGESGANQGIAMKLLQIMPRAGTRLYSAMIKKQAEIRKSGRGTFSRAGARRRQAVRWTHVRYKGSINLEPGLSEAIICNLTKMAGHRYGDFGVTG